MKSKKFLTYAVLVIMFCVAVSGGCGGGSSGHYSGNFGDSGDSSQEVTAEYVSPDFMPPTPDEPALSDQFGTENADDDYGAGEINALMLLTKTTWSIEQVEIYQSYGSASSYDIREGNNYNAKTITFLISGKEVAWATEGLVREGEWAEEDSKKTPIDDDLTVLFKDFQDGAWQTAPILRPGTFYEYAENLFYQASITGNNQIGAGTETIQILERFENTPLVAKKILVTNQFTAANGTNYTCRLHLSRVDNFFLLDQTDWQIKNIQVFGVIKDSNGNYTYGNPNNYIITGGNQGVNKIAISTYVNKNKARFFTYLVNDRATRTLTANFTDTILNKKFQAPFLRVGSGFQSKGTQDVYEIFEAMLDKDDFPGNELLYISNYGPNADITINNDFYYVDKNNGEGYHYWARLILEPYNPNKK